MNYAIAVVDRVSTLPTSEEIYSWGDNSYKQCGHEFKTKKEKQNNQRMLSSDPSKSKPLSHGKSLDFITVPQQIKFFSKIKVS